MKISAIVEHHKGKKINSTKVGRLFLSKFAPVDLAEVYGEMTGEELRKELHRIYTPSNIDRHDVDIDKEILELIVDTSC